ncbi:MAG: hypothetical protein ACKOT0_00865, partial [bacterium]
MRRLSGSSHSGPSAETAAMRLRAASGTLRLYGAGAPRPRIRVAGMDPRWDPELVEHGDTRNVVDRYRNWTVEAIVADLDARRHPFHVAIENFEHDMNIGSVVRSANAFLAAEVHIVGH